MESSKITFMKMKGNKNQNPQISEELNFDFNTLQKKLKLQACE